MHLKCPLAIIWATAISIIIPDINHCFKFPIWYRYDCFIMHHWPAFIFIIFTVGQKGKILMINNKRLKLYAVSSTKGQKYSKDHSLMIKTKYVPPIKSLLLHCHSILEAYVLWKEKCSVYSKMVKLNSMCLSAIYYMY